MLRTDGDHLFYIIRHKYMRDDDWASSGDCGNWCAKVDKRYWDQFHKLNKAFMASGACWQSLGEFGTFEKKTAILLALWLQEHLPEHQFAVFEVKITQTRTPICVMS